MTLADEEATSTDNPIYDDAMRAWGAAMRRTEQQIGINLQFWATSAAYRTGVGFFGFLLVAIIGVCLYFAFRLQNESFFQLLSIEIAAGGTTFLATPLIIKLAAKKRGLTICITVVLALTKTQCDFYKHLIDNRTGSTA